MNKKLPILYTFRRCPYAIRARLAIASSGCEIVWREVVLRAKPDSLLRVSPKATVPVLQLESGQVIEESWEIMIWALEHNDPDNWLDANHNTNTKTTIQNQINALILENDVHFKPSLDRYKYADRYPEKSVVEYRAEGERFLELLEQRLKLNLYLAADHCTLADAAIFPFIRQFAGVDPAWFEQASYPRLRSWLQQWLDSKLFQSVMAKLPPWQEGDTPLVFPFHRSTRSTVQLRC